MKKKLGIYIHIPFCLSRCGYCGFYSNSVGSGVVDVPVPMKGLPEPGGDPEISVVSLPAALVMKSYYEGILEEIDRTGKKYGDRYVADTIFFGGGTPSLLDPKWIHFMVERIRERFGLTPDAEITLESNPKTLDLKKLRQMRAAGVNRLSIGLQSLSPKVLGIMNRVHTPEDFLRCYHDARHAGFHNINVDIMFAVPGQSPADWMDTLAQVLALQPEHLSFYSLQIEEGTRFYEDYRAGRLALLDDETDRAMYHKGLERIRAAGYRHYEISNAAKPGFECRHNLKYWRFQEYLGLGAAASSFLEGRRITRASDLMYRSLPPAENHENSFEDDAGEYAFTALRLSEGIRYRDFKARFGRAFRDVFGERWGELDEFFRMGELTEDEEGLRLTEKGIDISNRIMEVFV